MGPPGGAVYQPVTLVTPQGHVMAQAISPSKIHIQNSQVWTSHKYTACFKAVTHTHSINQINTLTCCAFSPSIYSCRWIRILDSSLMKTVLLKTSVAFSPNRPPTSCAHGSSSTLRWVCQSDANVNTVNIIQAVVWQPSFSCYPQHPYPTEDEKKQIAHQTNLTLLQVNNWYVTPSL